MNLEKIIDEAVENGEVAGMNVLVRQYGNEVFYHQAGYKNLEKKTPYTRDTITRCYSMTKPITGAAIMLLMERGKLNLGQPVSDFLPAYKKAKVWENGTKVAPHHEPLIKELLGMTSGFPYPGNLTSPASAAVTEVFEDIDRGLGKDQELSTREIAERLAECGMEYHPGESWAYGTSADILGAVVEAASGMSFGDFLKENFFEPLGMEDTGFYIPKEKADRLADVYERTSEGLKLNETRHLGMTYERTNKPNFESGGAGLLSTIDDYAKFAQMLLDDGKSQHGKHILSDKTIDYFTNPKLNFMQQQALIKCWPSLNGYSYGNLLRNCLDPNQACFRTWEGEYGWDGWLGTFFANSPMNGLTILMTYQIITASNYPITERLRNGIFYEF